MSRFALPAGRPLIAPSLLSCDFARIADEVRAVEDAGADLLHVDVMDGRFVSNITVGPPIVAAIRRSARVPLDVHLMIVEPERYLAAFAEAGAGVLTVHVETCAHLHRTVQAIRALGCAAGVCVNPATPISLLEDILPDIDLVLVMSVNPGFGGQEFIPAALGKIAALRGTLAARGLTGVAIEVDGGVGPQNASALVDAGADVLVSGNALFGSGDLAGTIAQMRGG